MLLCFLKPFSVKRGLVLKQKVLLNVFVFLSQLIKPSKKLQQTLLGSRNPYFCCPDLLPIPRMASTSSLLCTRVLWMPRASRGSCGTWHPGAGDMLGVTAPCRQPAPFTDPNWRGAGEEHRLDAATGWGVPVAPVWGPWAGDGDTGVTQGAECVFEGGGN